MANKNNNKPNYLYFIGTENHIKIGITSDPDKRLQTVQTGCPIQCNYLAVFDCGLRARDFEYKIHEIFKRYKTHGEWFKRNKEILAFIKKSIKFESLKYNMWEEEFNSVYYVEGDEMKEYMNKLRDRREKLYTEIKEMRPIL